MRILVIAALGGYIVRAERPLRVPLEWGPYARRADAEAMAEGFRRDPSRIAERDPKKPKLRQPKGQGALGL